MSLHIYQRNTSKVCSTKKQGCTFLMFPNPPRKTADICLSSYPVWQEIISLWQTSYTLKIFDWQLLSSNLGCKHAYHIKANFSPPNWMKELIIKKWTINIKVKNYLKQIIKPYSSGIILQINWSIFIQQKIRSFRRIVQIRNRNPGTTFLISDGENRKQLFKKYLK